MIADEIDGASVDPAPTNILDDAASNVTCAAHETTPKATSAADDAVPEAPLKETLIDRSVILFMSKCVFRLYVFVFVSVCVYETHVQFFRAHEYAITHLLCLFSAPKT